jgi:hypothetical protein
MDTTEAAASPSLEAAFLDEMRGRATRWIGIGVLLAVVSACILVAELLGSKGVIVGCVGAGLGVFFVWFGFVWLRILPEAQAALAEPSIDVRLEAKRNAGVWQRSTNAQLWSKDSVTPPSLAQFSETFHWAKPRYLAVDKIPAKVYGTPIKNATVVVSCSDGVLVGRIKRSHL